MFSLIKSTFQVEYGFNVELDYEFRPAADGGELYFGSMEVYLYLVSFCCLFRKLQ